MKCRNRWRTKHTNKIWR